MIGLGIDAGGTYTDAVIFDTVNGKVLAKAKALTTRHDLSIGIRNVVATLNSVSRQMPWSFTDIELASLSTTLATNSIVEGKGGNAGLILIGYDPELVGRLITVKQYEIVKGCHNIDGNEIQPLDEEELASVAKSFLGKVDALAISSYLAARNPEHEIRARQIVSRATGIPVVCGHDLSVELDSIKRATTAVLNARLIPVIVELIKAVRDIMNMFAIKAPLMIVKGDGSLMSEEMAMSRPVETILSGPAASVAGATYLAGVKDAIILDMGGTTSDLAIVSNGSAKINPKGASVGGHRTCVAAADVTTSGLGGDSYVQITRSLDVEIGPRRVVPISYLSQTYQGVKDELSRLAETRLSALVQPIDFFVLVKRPGDTASLHTQELAILELLDKGPASRYQICDELSYQFPSLLRTDGLEERGYIIRSGFTPTDALHVLRELDMWDKDAAVIAAEILGRYTGKSHETFAAYVKETVVKKLAKEVASMVFAQALGKAPSYCEVCDFLVNQMLVPGFGTKGFNIDLSIAKPLVGIGAPIDAYLPEAARLIGCELKLPEHADVANAVGAITGRIMQKCTATIRPTSDGRFVVHAVNARKEFDNYEDAAGWAEAECTLESRRLAEEAGAIHVEATCSRHRKAGTISSEFNDDTIFIETLIEAVAVGNPVSPR